MREARGKRQPGNPLPGDDGSEVMPGHEPRSQVAQHGGQSSSYISSFSPGRGGSTGQVIRRSTWSSVTLGGRMESWGSWQESGTGEGKKRQTLNASLDLSQSGICTVKSTAGCGREGPHDPPGPISVIPAAGAWWSGFTCGVIPLLFLPAFSLLPLGNISPLATGSRQGSHPGSGQPGFSS